MTATTTLPVADAPVSVSGVPAAGNPRGVPDAVAAPQRRPGIRVVAIVIGILAATVSFAGSWIPSFWGDEAASVMSAERPISTLFGMVQHIDAVHGLYYLFLHGWIDLFGASELSTRLPSAIGVGLAVAGTVVLANLLFDRRVAVIAGLVFAVLPRVTYMGAEARSYALGTAIAVWLTVLLVVLLRRRTTRKLPWLLYSLGFALAVYSFLYLILLGLVHSVLLLAMPGARTMLKRWLRAAGLGMVLALPIIVFALGEHGQVSFLASRPKFSSQTVFVDQWFGNNSFATLCWALIAVGVLAAAWAWRGRPHAGTAPIGALRALPVGMIVAVAWLVLPTLLLELGNAFIAPMYTTRYLSFCTPAVAILVATGVAVLGRLLLSKRWMPVAAVALLVALVAPTYLAQRGPYAKNSGSDWRQASAVIGQHARPGDAIVFDTKTKPSQRPRLAMRLYPADYTGLDDVALVTPFYQGTELWDTVAPLSRVTGRLASTGRVWAMEMKRSGASVPADVAELEQLGFQVQHEYPVHRTVVYELSRTTS
jgi:mannosyltransferase